MSVKSILFSKEDADLEGLNWRISTSGYACATLFGKLVLAHRLVLERVHGCECPKHLVSDHVNRIRLDNRRENLRRVTHGQNSQNKDRHSKCTSGYRGVTKTNGNLAKPWQAQVGHMRKNIFLGRFATPQEASEAVEAKRKELNFLDCQANEFSNPD